jgi:hypothetical protein
LGVSKRDAKYVYFMPWDISTNFPEVSRYQNKF